jgi:DNA helicase-2/ATP-dependent DNA helicase PcrA
MWVGTFHSISHRLLRENYKKANLVSDFQILDSQDQFRIIKRIAKEQNIDEANTPIKQLQGFINKQKNKATRAIHINAKDDYHLQINLRIFELYEEYCDANNLVDFAELLLRSYELLQNNPDILQYYQSHFKYILIDEFQDTNTIQYSWIKSFYSGKNIVFCVGDDDQSIYGWRGAKIENIKKFKNDFKPINIAYLEQNYRSTGNILKASNALIKNNNGRMDKSLWTDSENGELIEVFQAKDEANEADFIVNKIIKYADKGIPKNQFAILYRSNAQSRIFEETLIKYDIPYTIYGGLKFFERAEIKNAICYLRLVENNNDNIAFERIINIPARGIGNVTINKITTFANENHTSLFFAANEIALTLTPKIKNAIISFIENIKNIENSINSILELHKKVDYIIRHSGLIEYYSNEKIDKTGNKKENLEELVNAAKQYSYQKNSKENDIKDFIDLSLLDADNGNEANHNQKVQLMTIHSAKGLEFSYIFLTGMEENLFPSIKSKEEPYLIDEERRLCYVGMTRAMTELTLSYALKRFINGNIFYPRPSRFIEEIPTKYISNKQDDSYERTYQKTYNNIEHKKINTDIKPNSKGELSIGATVQHIKFGIGTVINFEGSGESTRVQIQFNKFGTKWLIGAYANLKFI